MRLLSADISGLWRSLETAAQPSGISTTPPSFAQSANLLRVHSHHHINEKVQQYWLWY